MARPTGSWVCVQYCFQAQGLWMSVQGYQLCVYLIPCRVTARGRTRLCREGPMSGEAALPGVSSACHICIYLKLSWWSSVSGMPRVGLAYYYLGLD